MPLYNASNTTGWNQITETFTYASATTITVTSGATNRWQSSDKLMLTQHGSVKYFWIVAVADTLLTVVCNGAVVVENTGTYPITVISYSRIENPFGFPFSFTFTPVATYGVARNLPTNAPASGRISIVHGRATVDGSVSVVDKGSATGYMGIVIPVTPSNAASGSAQEVAATGFQFTTSASASDNRIITARYDYATPWVNGYNIYFSCSFLI